MAKTLLLFILFVSFVEKSTQTVEGEHPPLFVGTSTPGGPNYIISPTGEVRELSLVNPVHRAVWDEQHLFFVGRNDESVYHFNRYTGVERRLITMGARVSSVNVDRTTKRLFLGILGTGIRSYDYEGQDEIIVTTIPTEFDVSAMFVDEVNMIIYYISGYDPKSSYLVSYDNSPNDAEKVSNSVPTTFVSLAMVHGSSRGLVLMTHRGGLGLVLVDESIPGDPQPMGSAPPNADVTAAVITDDFKVYYTDLTTNAIWHLTQAQQLTLYASNIGTPEFLCIYPTVVVAWGAWSEWIASGSVQTRSRECLEASDHVVPSVMCSGNSSETLDTPPAPIWNCPKLWRNCYGNGRCLPYYYGGRQIKSLATCECNEGFTGLWCDLRTDGSSVIWPWMSKRRVRTRRLA